MAATRLGLYELLAPQFLAGFTFPDYIDRYLSILGVDELRTSFDESGIVYTGRVSFTGEAGALAERQHRHPSGAVFEWEDVTLDFRLTIPRDGAAFVKSAIDAGVALTDPADDPFVAMNDLFNALGAVEQTATAATEYPGIRFRLELLVSLFTFHMGESWKPGKVGDDFRIISDPALADQDVKFVLPKIVLQYEQGDDLSQPPDFRLNSWGNSGFDAPSDLAEGELIRMEPPIAVHSSGRVAFGVDQVLLDLSKDHTPPEILAFFGTDEAFTGLFIKSVRFFYSDKDKDFAFNIAVNDVLISFAGEVSLEAEIDVLGPATTFDVRVLLYNGPNQIAYTPADGTTAAQATIPNTGVIQVVTEGGVPPFTTSVTLDASTLAASSRGDYPISPGAPGSLHPPTGATPSSLVVTVADSNSPPQSVTRTINLRITAAEPANAEQDGGTLDRPPEAGARPNAIFTADQSGLHDGRQVNFEPATSGISETLTFLPGSISPTVTIGGTPRTIGANHRVTFDVPEGSDASPIPVAVTWPAAPQQSETFRLEFDFEKPKVNLWDGIKARYIAIPNDTSLADQNFFASPVARGPLSVSTAETNGKTGAAGLREWITNHVVAVTAGSTKDVSIEAHASYEDDPTKHEFNLHLSERRLQVAREIITGASAIVSSGTAHGQDAAQSVHRVGVQRDRVALITGVTSLASPGQTLNGTISRAATPPPTTPTSDPVVTPSPAPAPPPNRKPSVFRRISFRVRLERNVLVLLEVSGELDFETELEGKLRNASGDTAGNLGLEQVGDAASSNPNRQDGVVDFTINITYDTSTHFLTETLTLGAAPADIDGLLQMTNEGASRSTFKDIFGALLIFTPIINSVASSVETSSAGDWAVMAVSLAVPVTIGALGVFQTQKVTLYGGELKSRQVLPPGGSLDLTDTSITFDYGVEFKIEIDALDIHSTRALKVRYKAVGFNLHFADGVSYQPIFDTSKGYEIDLRDPGLFNLPAPLGDLLKVLSARIANFNPLTLELDLGMKVDLGVVTVDRFKIKWPIHPLGAPMILPTGVHVDISNVIVGSGYVNIVDGGFDGTMDITIVPVKIRVAASLGVHSIPEPPDPTINRKATAIFAALTVEFPTPIVLAATGLGIYAFSGLFAMHYKRTEDPRSPGDSVSPALKWLMKANGEPARLANTDTATPVDLWVPEFDRWSFGVGAVLATLDGGTLVNLRGMFVLELPGPRILIFVKIKIISELPKLKPAGRELITGILGVVDLDFNLGHLTIGIIVDFDVHELLKIQIPVELFFNLNDTRDWHLDLGTISQPAAALVLNLVRARGYLMIHGDQILPFPPGSSSFLPGIAVAAGIEASLVYGSESAGLYLRISARADLGVSFSPFFMVGKITISGELHLFIIGIEAHGTLDVEAPDPTFVHGEICGSVDFFFFSVEGCVGFSIGDNTRSLPAPALVKGVYLQSFAPVLTSGQGGDRPIDSSLGDAPELGSGAPVPVVPIDTVPVIQLHASPRLASGVPTVWSVVNPSPGLTFDGWINVGGGRQVRYLLKEVTLDPPLVLATGSPHPPATWRRDKPPGPQGVDSNIDLALLSHAPTTATHALERSTELDTQVEIRWRNLCKKPAPPSCVLWTFCGQQFGPSGHGWNLIGKPQPDPPDTIRHQPPPTDLFVEEPVLDPSDRLLDLVAADDSRPFLVPARVIGLNLTSTIAITLDDDAPGRINPKPQRKGECFRVLQFPQLDQASRPTN